MTRRVVLRPAAERDLHRLVDFLAKLDERAANRRQEWLHESLQRLALEGESPGLSAVPVRRLAAGGPARRFVATIRRVLDAHRLAPR